MILDAFPAFPPFWETAKTKTVDERISGWASEYMSAWPELLDKQQEKYREQQTDWREIARERIFPFLEQRFLSMRKAHENLLRHCEPAYRAAEETLGFESGAIFVIYVGIGCGAGWVTTYQDLPAVLFGLENIAECGWSGAESICGMAAHEFGHIAHIHVWRPGAGLAIGSGPLWDLYEEGFAERCEHAVNGEGVWHDSQGINSPDWLAWCQDHKSQLASEFLRLVATGESVRSFFGHWFDIQGRKQCGYYLGHEAIKTMETKMSLKEIALLEAPEEAVRCALQEMIG